MDQTSAEISQIRDELKRLSIDDGKATLDPEFEPEAGELVKLEIGSAYWHLLPQELLNLMEELPDGAGGEQLKRAIEQSAAHVWHGPAPEGSRDRSL